MKNVDDMSDAELYTELQRRSDERKRQEVAKGHTENANIHAVFNQMGVANLGMLLRVLTEHETISCNDTNLSASYIDHNSQVPRCTRCYLLEMMKYNSTMDDHLRLILRFEQRYTP